MKVNYITQPEKIPQLNSQAIKTINKVSETYAFRTNSYYNNLINWDDPEDPIKKIVIPEEGELTQWGTLDASNEHYYTVAKACQHKYQDTALLLVNEVCGAYCRYCFRKRLFMNDNDEASYDISEGLSYISNHPEITNVLLTGGDPMILGNKRIKQILQDLRNIPHVNIIRIGTKMTAFNPFRISEDKELLSIISEHSKARKRIYIMNHFDHPREITPEAIEAVTKLISAGAICVNQCPLVKGVNDNSAVLAELFKKLSFIGCPQYYLFQGRPTEGNQSHVVPMVQGYFLFEESKKYISGLAKRVKYVMSHSSGKVEIIGVDDDFIFLKYHRSRDKKLLGKIRLFRRDDNAYWMDNLIPFELKRSKSNAPVMTISSK